MRSTGKPRCFTPSFRLLAITQLIDCAGRQPQPARLLAPLFVRYFIQLVCAKAHPTRRCHRMVALAAGTAEEIAKTQRPKRGDPSPALSPERYALRFGHATAAQGNLDLGPLHQLLTRLLEEQIQQGSTPSTVESAPTEQPGTAPA